MLQFFKHNYLIHYAVVVIVAALAWLPFFLRLPETLPETGANAPLYHFLAELLGPSPLAMSIVTFAAFVFALLFFNAMLTSNQLASRNSTLGALTFVLCMACTPLRCENFQFLLACPFIMLAMQTMYSLLQNDKPETYLFNVGLFMSIASLFYYTSMILILWVLLALIMIGYKSLRLFLIPFCGMLLPYFVLFVIAYFNHGIFVFLDTYSHGFCGLEIYGLNLDSQEIITISVLVFLFLLSVLKVMSSSNGSISVRKKNNMTTLLLLFSIVMTAMQRPAVCNGLFFMTLAIFFAMALSAVKKSKIVDVVVVMSMLAVIAVQYLPLFI